MIIRVKIDNSVTLVRGIDEKDEATFLDKNPNTDFRIVKELPTSEYSCWKLVNNEIVVDVDKENLLRQESINEDNKAYLSSTDWYITRNAETGVDIPQDILDKRAEAREAIV